MSLLNNLSSGLSNLRFTEALTTALEAQLNDFKAEAEKVPSPIYARTPTETHQ